MKLLSTVLFFITLPVLGQDVVASFPAGSSRLELGIEARLENSGEYLSEATGLVFDGQSFFLSDGVNLRIVELNKSFVPIDTKAFPNGVLANLWVDRDVIVTGWNPNGPDKFWHTTITQEVLSLCPRSF